MKTSRFEKHLITLGIIFAVIFGTSSNVFAMHIMEGYLPAVHCIAWGAICVPFAVTGFISIRHLVSKNAKSITMLAMAGAFIFIISSLKIPSVTGSCSHMTGTGLGAILFGPFATCILGIIVLIFQAVLLAHGGLTTLGANTFSMAIVGPILTCGLFILGKKLKVNRKLNIGIAAAAGDLITYCVTSFQLAAAYPSETGGIGASMLKFLGVFAPTQLPLAVLEGILTVVIMTALESYAQPEMKAIGYRFAPLKVRADQKEPRDVSGKVSVKSQTAAEMKTRL